eukprot:CAMPEP_0175265980 /NCGR_PEP_ID=MMETSP0093-20121207/43098_1 /TAXON_ID=311494 /ORGANISM="Alexandrium monilatum, Strain CCMP3105" /LENGTH=219 /DNA_ID=CAMNT_0016560573 /DNA_START=23 /DNA_END=683 /DNA_ORIENTATION=-
MAAHQSRQHSDDLYLEPEESASSCRSTPLPAPSSGRVLRACLSDPGPGPDLARLPPWLEALAEVEEEDVWFSRRSSDVPCKVEGSRVSCSEQQGEAQEEAQAVAGSEPHDKPARCTSGPSGGGESLPEYCKVLEQRVGQLYAALRNSEAARKRLASAGSEACEAPLGLSPPRASREAVASAWTPPGSAPSRRAATAASAASVASPRSVQTAAAQFAARL